MEEQPITHDGVGRGVAMTMACQIVLIVVSALLTVFGGAANVGGRQLTGIFMDVFFGWGVAQWAALIPLYVMQKRKGRFLAAKGILITGCVGFLLNAACAGIFFGRQALTLAPLRAGKLLPTWDKSEIFYRAS